MHPLEGDGELLESEIPKSSFALYVYELLNATQVRGWNVGSEVLLCMCNNGASSFVYTTVQYVVEVKKQ